MAEDADRKDIEEQMLGAAIEESVDSAFEAAIGPEDFALMHQEPWASDFEVNKRNSSSLCDDLANSHASVENISSESCISSKYMWYMWY